MKQKFILPLVGLVACSLAVVAQTNTVEPSTTNTAPPAEAVVSPSAPATPTNAPSATTEAAPAVVETPATNATPAPAVTVETPAAPAAPAAPVAAPAAQQPDGVIPLIVMDDVPLTDAVRNLARQAGLNFILDPKVNFGQPGPDGRPVPQPNISIRWENVTAEQALQALLATYGLQLIEDPKTKINRVTVKDPAAPDPLTTKIIQLKYAGPSNVLASVQTTLTDKRSRVTVDNRTSQLVVVATEKEMNDVDKLIARLDLPTKQVLIEAKLLETSMNPSTIKGLDWSGTLQAQHLAFGNNLQTKPVVANESVNPPLSTLWPKAMFDTAHGFNPATAFLDADGVNAVFSFINQYAEARVLSAPRTVTLDNETAHISVTRASPIINVTPGTANTTGGSQITYTNLGVILDVTPRISANETVNLKVAPEVSRIFDTVTKVVSSGTFQADEYDVRKLETQVVIPSGNTLVLGGLVQDDQREANSKVPVLGDIPLLGHMFRSDSKSRQKNNLLIFITPTIVQDTDFHPTKTDFLQTPVQTTEGKEWSAWDSGKPLDWSKVMHRKSE